jgi:hypothetical protein
MVVPNFGGTPPRLARVVGAVQHTPAWAAIGAGLRSQVMVDAQQQREKLGVVQKGMAHCDGL